MSSSPAREAVFGTPGREPRQAATKPLDVAAPRARDAAPEKPYRSGDRVNSSRHQGELVVAVAGSRVLICSKCRKNGRPGRQEVVVDVEDVRCVRHMLPT